MGLWHGAGWTFALWGLFHACVILLYRYAPFLSQLPKKVPLLGWCLMLLIAMASWIPFRSNSVEQELIMFAKIANPFDYTWATRSVGGYTYILTAVVLLAMLGAYGCKWVHETYAVPRLVVSAAATVSVALMASSILLFMRDVKQFIYFQFRVS